MDTLHASQTTNQNIPNSHILLAEFLQSLHATWIFSEKNLRNILTKNSMQNIDGRCRKLFLYTNSAKQINHHF